MWEPSRDAGRCTVVCQVPPELTWGDPGSHVVLRALDGAWS